MKALVVVSVVLVLLAVAVFFVGWVQILIPAGTYAVIHTKTGGYEQEVVTSGEFMWRVERLLPTNMKLYRFKPEVMEVDVPVVSGVLPSGELYASFMENSPDFSYEIDLKVFISVIPESLPRLVAEEDLRPDGLGQWLEQKAHRVGLFAADVIRDDPMALSRLSYRRELLDRIAQNAEFAGVDIQRIDPVRVKLPDPDLYDLAKETYIRVSEAREARDLLAIEEEKTNLKVLREYAELMTEYPVLIRFLYLKELGGEGLDILELELPETFGTAEESGD